MTWPLSLAVDGGGEKNGVVLPRATKMAAPIGRTPPPGYAGFSPDEIGERSGPGALSALGIRRRTAVNPTCPDMTKSGP